MSVGHPGWGEDGWARAQLMFSLLQGEPGVPGQSGTPGKEGLIGPKVWPSRQWTKGGQNGAGKVMAGSWGLHVKRGVEGWDTAG